MSSHKWTCGECGDSYEASGYLAGIEVDRWANDHKERHRVEKLPEAEREALLDARIRAELARLGRGITE